MKNKKLFYLTHARLPTEKAFGVQMAHMLKAFSSQAEVTLVATVRPNDIQESIWEYYGVTKGLFAVERVWAYYAQKSSSLSFWVHMLSYSVGAFRAVKKSRADIVYSREPFPLYFLAHPSRKTVFEMHDFPRRGHRVYKSLCTRVSHIVTTNQWAKDQCVEQYGIAAEKITVAPNGYDEADYAAPTVSPALREKMSVDGRPIALYSGHLYDWKGAHVLAEAAEHMPEVQVVFLGGNEKDRGRMQREYHAPNITWIPHVPPHEVAAYVCSAHVLVLPNIPKNQHSKYSTSPIKLFEYLASGVPVVSSDLPSIRALVDDRTLTFVSPDDAKVLALALQDALSSEEVKRRATFAREYVRRYSWGARAKTIIAKLEF